MKTINVEIIFTSPNMTFVAKWQHKQLLIFILIDSGYGLLPDRANPLPESMLKCKNSYNKKHFSVLKMKIDKKYRNACIYDHQRHEKYHKSRYI